MLSFNDILPFLAFSFTLSQLKPHHLSDALGSVKLFMGGTTPPPKTWPSLVDALTVAKRSGLPQKSALESLILAIYDTQTVYEMRRNLIRMFLFRLFITVTGGIIIKVYFKPGSDDLLPTILVSLLVVCSTMIIRVLLPKLWLDQYPDHTLSTWYLLAAGKILIPPPNFPFLLDFKSPYRQGLNVGGTRLQDLNAAIRSELNASKERLAKATDIIPMIELFSFSMILALLLLDPILGIMGHAF